jgi:ubiquinone/menaquinone biosynthesis C-methylase UbiE
VAALFLSFSATACKSGARVRRNDDDPRMPERPIFARLYDRLTAPAERNVFGEMRRELLAEASGRTLDIGSGTGHNLAHYPPAVTELVLAEPDPHMAKQLREKLSADPPAAEKVSVIEAPAEDLPFDDGSFDTVVATLVLCTVEDPERAVAEARRVLVEGGKLIFLEHVRSSSRRLARWQDWLERPWGFFAGGCHPNRPTDQTLAESGFWIERLDRDATGPVPIVRPLISGIARRPSAAEPE